MLSAIYLIIVFLIGDLVGRRFFTFTSFPNRFAASFLIGLFLSTWLTYFVALAFAATAVPMLFGNTVFFIVAIGLLVWRYFRDGVSGIFPVERGLDYSDWLMAAIYTAISFWLMFGTFAVTDTNLKIGAFLWNDFGPNLSLVQSFAVGHNFPTEYPHFIGEPIRYHFLFWFQAGNLEFLGLNIAWSLNILSTLTMAAMLVLIDAFGRMVFGSKAVGRIGALLFFFHGSLSYIPFLLSKGSVSEMLAAIWNVSEWINSIYKFPGEQWGVWSMGTFLAQRHLPAAIGLFLVVLNFLVQQGKEKEADPTATVPTEIEDPDRVVKLEEGERKAPRFDRRRLGPYLFAGILIGLLPLWNGAILVGALAVIGSMVIFFRQRSLTMCLLAVSTSMAIPQILFLRASGTRGLSELFRWGYVVEPATVWNVAEYFLFTFGVKFILAAVALVMLSGFQRRLFAVICSLAVLAFTTQLSTDVMNNHKFLNLWLVLINCYAAYTFVRIARIKYAGKVFAALLMVLTCFGGAIELMRIWNVNDVDVPYRSGRLYEWLEKDTQTNDVFLTDKHVHSPILLAGRRIYYGWSYFGWSMGYPTGERDTIYKRLYSQRDPSELVRLLRENRIDYVAFDEGLRNGYLKNELNEFVFEANFEKVFTDTEKKYGSLVIYRVP